MPIAPCRRRLNIDRHWNCLVSGCHSRILLIAEQAGIRAMLTHPMDEDAARLRRMPGNNVDAVSGLQFTAAIDQDGLTSLVASRFVTERGTGIAWCGSLPAVTCFYACVLGENVASRSPGRSTKSWVLSVKSTYPCSMACAASHRSL